MSCEEVTDKIVFSNLGYKSGDDINVVDMTNCTLTFERGTNNTDKPYYNKSVCYFYLQNVLTISAKAGNIKKVVFKLVKLENKPFSASTFSPTGSKSSNSDLNTYTWTATAPTFVFINRDGVTQIIGLDVTVDNGTETKTINLYDNEDNSSVLNDNLNQVVNVTVNRTLSASYWNTFSLPFDVKSGIIATTLNNAQVKEFTSMNGTNMVFTQASEIKAGVPYLVKPTKDVTNPTFNNVTIAVTDGKKIDFGNYSYKALLNPHDMLTDGTEQFLGTNGELYIPASNTNKINGLRAIFLFKNGTQKNAKVYISETDGIENVPMDVMTRRKGVYSLSGQYLGSSTEGLVRGIYIVDGVKTVK